MLFKCPWGQCRSMCHPSRHLCHFPPLNKMASWGTCVTTIIRTEQRYYLWSRESLESCNYRAQGWWVVWKCKRPFLKASEHLLCTSKSTPLHLESGAVWIDLAWTSSERKGERWKGGEFKERLRKGSEKPLRGGDSRCFCVRKMTALSWPGWSTKKRSICLPFFTFIYSLCLSSVIILGSFWETPSVNFVVNCQSSEWEHFFYFFFKFLQKKIKIQNDKKFPKITRSLFAHSFISALRISDQMIPAFVSLTYHCTPH